MEGLRLGAGSKFLDRITSLFRDTLLLTRTLESEIEVLKLSFQIKNNIVSLEVYRNTVNITVTLFQEQGI